MLTLAVWALGAAALLGVGLSGFYLAEKPISGAGRLASVVHGLVGFGGAILALVAVLARPDPQGMGRIGLGFLAASLVAALLIIIGQVRRRRPPGLVVALHATGAVAALVILAGYLSMG